MSKAVRNVKKVVEKVNHTSKLRTNIQAQMAVGKAIEVFSCYLRIHAFFPIQLVRRLDLNLDKEALILQPFAKTLMKRLKISRRELHCLVE